MVACRLWQFGEFFASKHLRALTYEVYFNKTHTYTHWLLKNIPHLLKHPGCSRAKWQLLIFLRRSFGIKKTLYSGVSACRVLVDGSFKKYLGWFPI